MNPKDELKKALAPLKIEVYDFKDFENYIGDDCEYGQCDTCDFEGELEDTGKCCVCQEQEDEEMLKEMEYEYYSGRGV